VELPQELLPAFPSYGDNGYSRYMDYPPEDTVILADRNGIKTPLLKVAELLNVHWDVRALYRFLHFYSYCTCPEFTE
jgi:hypothetical protein